MSTVVDQDDLSPLLPTPIRWRNWALRDKPLRAALVAVALAALGLVVFRLTGQAVMSWIGALAMGVALWRLFLPVDYELSVGGVDQWILGRRYHSSWQSIRGYEVCTAGAVLLPQGPVCPLDALFGVYLPWMQHRNEVLAHLRQHLGDPLKETANPNGSLRAASA